jgi:hypothetical protein
VTFAIGTASGGYTITPDSGSAVTFAIDTDDCSLDGAGIETAPFLVSDGDDLQLVGSSTGCGLGDYYLQTADISAVNTAATAAFHVDGTFDGVYDGDHYSISFASTGFNKQLPLFDDVTGTIKKLRLTGSIESDAAEVAPLVVTLGASGVISEVLANSVQVESNQAGSTVGGLVATVDGASRIQYSASTARLYWDISSAGDGPSMGGLVGKVAADFEIRDSYAQPSFRADSSDIASDTPCGVSTNQDIYLGGLVGDLEDGHALTIVRAYATPSLTDTATANRCTDRFELGGLVGLVEDSADLIDANVLSAFWLNSFSTTAVGVFDEAGADGEDGDGGDHSSIALTKYDGGDPVAVPLSAALLKTRSTYQSAEDSETAGVPSGDADLSGVGTGENEDYRWAIESMNVRTFVESSYDADDSDDYPGSVSELNDYTNRVALDNTVARAYRTQGGGDLLVHGGSDPEDVDTSGAGAYPTIGRVWEMCDDYPNLVWEEEDSCTGTGSSGSRDDDDEESSTTAAAAALGLSDAEYAEFLASGLTLEQFLAARLAATGPASSAMTLGAGAVVLLFSLGLTLLMASRHRRTGSLGQTG